MKKIDTFDSCHHLPIKGWRIKKTKNGAQQVEIPQKGRRTPSPRGPSKLKANPSAELETSSSTMCSFLSNEETVAADFILDPPPTCKRWTWAVFPFYFFSRRRPRWLCCRALRKHIRKYFLSLSADACLPINQVTLVSSSRLPSRLTKYSGCSCYRLSWWATLWTSTSTTNTIWLWAVLKWMMGRCKVMC